MSSSTNTSAEDIRRAIYFLHLLERTSSGAVIKSAKRRGHSGYSVRGFSRTLYLPLCACPNLGYHCSPRRRHITIDSGK